MSKRFAYAIDKRYLPLLLPFGLRGSKDGVTLTDEGSLLATFGFIKIKTPLATSPRRTSPGTTAGGQHSVFAHPGWTTA
jgi:hypothetical protein